ncbi:hypothetical protein KC19_VG314300 [Ceratodon purpureus]|uniref:Uncharacterized protein n=1 Tax=Ceratodon purpureus TaxID=3225 RepID=A0A8T0HXF2_CERPU|nr:hypothetical protein KC19_VG314300 [Ceratodon purpureus]
MVLCSRLQSLVELHLVLPLELMVLQLLHWKQALVNRPFRGPALDLPRVWSSVHLKLSVMTNVS